MGPLSQFKISTKCGIMNRGDRIGIVYDFGKLEDPVYGIATNTSGLIPLISLHEHYEIPPIVYNEERLNKFAKTLRVQFANLWEEELDEVIEAKLKDYIIMTSFIKPAKEVESPEMRPYLMFTILAFVGDDVFDSIEDVGEIGMSYKSKKCVEMFENMRFGGENEKGDGDLPVLTEKLAPFIRHAAEFKKVSETYLPNFYERGEAFRQEQKNVLISFFLITESNRLGEGEGLTDESAPDLHGHIAGYMVQLEYFFMFEVNEILPEEVRQDMMFQRYRRCLANSTTLFNAIFGLKRDMRLNQVNDSPILRDVIFKGMKLQEALDATVQRLKNAMQDIRFGARMLRDRYGDNPTVVAYLECAERIYDGHLYSYVHVNRYGSLDLKIQKI